MTTTDALARRPYTLRDRALPPDATEDTSGPCVFCGALIRHINSDSPDANGWWVYAILDGRRRTFLYCNYACPPRSADLDGPEPSMWRCSCVADCIEVLGPRCVRCGTPRPPTGETAIPFFTLGVVKNDRAYVCLPDGASLAMPSRYARKLVRVNRELDWYRRDQIIIEGTERISRLRWYGVLFGRTCVRMPAALAHQTTRFLSRYVRVVRRTVRGADGPRPIRELVDTQDRRSLFLTVGELRRQIQALDDRAYVLVESLVEPRVRGRWYTQPATLAVHGAHDAGNPDYPFAPEGEPSPLDALPAICITTRRERR